MSAKSIFVAAVLLSPIAMAESASNSIFLYTRPEEFSFWRTAPTNSFLVPITFPPRALVAELDVSAAGYSSKFSGITPEMLNEEGLYRITLPQASKQNDENVYSLRLAFDDGTVRTAEVAVLCGVNAEGGEGQTQMILPSSSRKWRRRAGGAVVPVPYGAKTLEIDGNVVADDLDGARSWRFVEMPQPGGTSTYAIGDGASTLCEAELEGKRLGGAMLVR